ncbi:peptidoglycan-binding domain-containing protein [Roseovarius sp.]|uniref:peptidoglycan-binding domain-containing protein n=1 Tax=Roseovarius sp. TaxID=1486281 RepID=UPI003D0DF152
MFGSRTSFLPWKGFVASAFVVVLGGGAVLAQTETAEPLPEPPATTVSPLDSPRESQEGAGIDVMGAETDRDAPAVTEPAAAEDPGTADAAETEVAEATPSLVEQVAACYAGTSDAASDEEVRLQFVLDSAGLLLGIPEHVGAESQSAVQRRLFLDAVVALEECAPYSVSGVETTYAATFTQAAVTSIAVLDTAGPPETPPVLGTARVDQTASATEDIEAALDLSRDERREIQNRLRLVEYDPGGADGVFGPNTRTAISTWQEARGFPVSGYFNDVQLAALREESQAEYEAFQRTEPKPKPKRKAKRVRVCKRGVFGVLYDCRFVWR